LRPFAITYVYSLPPGPIWLLHTFHLITTALMLFWYVRYEGRRQGKGSGLPSAWAPVTQKGDCARAVAVFARQGDDAER